MKEKIARMLMERLEGRLTVLRHTELDEYYSDLVFDDIDEYLSLIKEMLFEVIKP